MHIHILTAEHFHVPGLITEAHADSSTATLKAVELVNIMLKDSRRKPTATAKNWRAKVEWLQDFHGAAHCYVEIAEHELVGLDINSVNDTVDSLVRAESFAAGFEDDETQEGIPDLLAGLRKAIQRERARPDLLAEVKEFRRTVEYYRRREASSGDDEGERLKSIKLVMLDDLIARAEGR
jgi:ElaB/YqjD/DUF883 family membrane-anchored ribosome-binding protein